MVRGHVYFDQNGNQHKDDDEQGCSTLGEKVTCDVTLLNPNAPKTIDLTFRLPETLNNDTTFTLQTSFLSRELGEPVNAEDISFSIQGPPKKEG